MGNLACLLAYIIFGFNIVCCKNISNSGTITPMALFLMRSLGAWVLFSIVSLLGGGKGADGKREKIERGDYWKIAVASFLGLFGTQLAFLKAITMTTAIDASILSVLSPIVTMIVAAIVLKDRISGKSILGLGLSLAGVLFLIFNTVTIRSGADHTSIGGILLMLVNTCCFACYVGIFKPLIQKYNVVTFMKWMFAVSTVLALPFGLKDLLAADYASMTPSVVLQLGFVVVFATFVAYFLVPVGQKRIRPMIVCMYSYVQPVIAMVISLAIGLDSFTWPKLAATVLVFLGVGVVNFQKK